MAVTPCPACGHENQDDQRFCVSCGRALQLTCQACGSASPPGARFCGNCGTPLAGPVAPRLSEERRLVTVLFADISGFTSHARERDPEEVTTMVDACMALLGAVVERYDGTVDKVIGDALMAVFGAPTAHEDDAERAIRAALDMQATAAQNADAFAGLSLRIGVNTGEVMFAPVGPGAERAFTVMGDAVNLAQRLQAAAPRGGVLVGETTRRLSSDAIRFGEEVAVQVKEGDPPSTGWPALDAAATPTERRMQRGALVGRDRELERLRAMWRQAADERRPQLATIFGPAGIGKTRLTAELAGEIEGDGGRVVRGRSLPYGEQSGFRAFAEQVAAIADVHETDSMQVARGKLESCVERLVPTDPVGTASRLASLVGLGDQDRADRREALFLAARQFVEGLARERPTALVFEDIHWADESLLDLVLYLAARVRDVPLLVLTLARLELRDRRPDWGGGLESFAAFRLEPLSIDDSVAQVTALLPDADAAVVTEIAQRAEGNPLFVEELSASVDEHAATSAQDLPDSIRGIIAARIDALPELERSVILDASVVGKTFWRGVLESVRVDGDGLVDALDALERRDLVRRTPGPLVGGHEQYVFKHMLIRDVAYDTLPRAVRRERHAAVAHYMEHTAGDRMPEYAATVAHHWLLAGDDRRATEYLLLAAEQARRSGARTEAVALYNAALEHLARDDVRHRETRARKGVALVELGALDAGIVELDGVLDELEGEEQFEALRARSWAAGWRMEAVEAKAFSQRGFELATRLGDTGLQAIALSQKAFAAAIDGSLHEAIEIDEQALTLWPSGVSDANLSELETWTGVHKHWLGASHEAVDHSRRGYELGRKTASVYGIVAGGTHLGLALTAVGRHEEALTVLGQALEEAWAIELEPVLTSRLINVLAGTLHELHDTEHARTTNHEAIENGERAGFPAAVLSGKIDLLFADLREGEVGSAEVAWPGLWEAAEASKGWHQWLWMTRLLAARAQIDLAAGRPEACLDEARRAIEFADGYGRLKYVCLSRLTLGEALLQLGRAAEAEPEARQAIADAATLGHPPTRAQAAALLGGVLLARGDETEALAAWDEARQVLETFAADLTPERRERYLAAAPVAEILARGH